MERILNNIYIILKYIDINFLKYINYEEFSKLGLFCELH